MAFGLKNTMVLVEQRRARRESVDVAVVARASNGTHIPLMVEVLSAGGFLASTPHRIAKDTLLDIIFPTARTIKAQVVWIEDGKIGCKFSAPANLPDLLKSAGGPRTHFERQGPVGLKRGGTPDTARGLPASEQTEPEIMPDAGPPPGAETPARLTAGIGDPAWLDQLGWLPIETYAAVANREKGYVRPVLLRAGLDWAFARMSATRWVDMTETRLGESLAFIPTFWTPASDSLAADLARL